MITGHIIFIKRARLSSEAKNKMQKLRRNLIKRAQCFKHFKRDCHSAPGIESIQDAFILDQLVVLHVSLHHFEVSHYRVAILPKVVLSACVEFATDSMLGVSSLI